MTETLESRAAALPPERNDPRSGDGAADSGPTELVGSSFFADVVRAHYAWERALNDGTDADRLPALTAE